MKAEVVVRSQHAKRGRSGFGGPDCYVAVVERPEGAPAVEGRPLSQANIRRFGWKVRRIGEGYSKYSGPRSMLGKAIREAEEIVRGVR